MQITSPPITFDSLLERAPSPRGVGGYAAATGAVTTIIGSYTVPANRCALALDYTLTLAEETLVPGVFQRDITIGVTKNGGSREIAAFLDDYFNSVAATIRRSGGTLNILMSAGDAIDISLRSVSVGESLRGAGAISIIEFDQT